MAKSELKKQLIDQPAHALWGFATGFLPFACYWLLGAPGAVYGWVAFCFSCCGWAFREIDQASDGSHLLWEGAPEWLDPALDSTVFVLALAGGIVTGVFAL